MSWISVPVALLIVRLVPSANKAGSEESRHFSKSFMKSKKSRGPRFDPCGTPVLIFSLFETDIPALQACCLWLRYEMNQRRVLLWSRAGPEHCQWFGPEENNDEKEPVPNTGDWFRSWSQSMTKFYIMMTIMNLTLKTYVPSAWIAVPSRTCIE